MKFFKMKPVHFGKFRYLVLCTVRRNSLSRQILVHLGLDVDTLIDLHEDSRTFRQILVHLGLDVDTLIDLHEIFQNETRALW